MRFKMIAEDGERWGSGEVQWKTVPQEMLCRRQWTDEYVEHPESRMRLNIVVVCRST